MLDLRIMDKEKYSLNEAILTRVPNRDNLYIDGIMSYINFNFYKLVGLIPLNDLKNNNTNTIFWPKTPYADNPMQIDTTLSKYKFIKPVLPKNARLPISLFYYSTLSYIINSIESNELLYSIKEMRNLIEQCTDLLEENLPRNKKIIVHDPTGIDSLKFAVRYRFFCLFMIYPKIGELVYRDINSYFRYAFDDNSSETYRKT